MRNRIAAPAVAVAAVLGLLLAGTSCGQGGSPATTAADGANSTSTDEAAPTSTGGAVSTSTSTAAGPGLTVGTSEGPYYITNTPQLVNGNLNATGLPGEPIKIVGHVYSGTDTSKPIASAKIEIWQADSVGVYHPAANGDMSQYSASDIALRGYILADRNGAYEFTTIYPGYYPGRTRHIHIRASAAGYGGITTQIIVPPKAGDGTTQQNDMIAGSLPPANFVTFSDQNGVQSGAFDFYLAAD